MSHGVLRCICGEPFAARTNGMGGVILECDSCHRTEPVVRTEDPLPSTKIVYVDSKGVSRRRYKQTRANGRGGIAGKKCGPRRCPPRKKKEAVA